MFTFIIIFAVALSLSLYFALRPSSTNPEVTPSESTSEEPIAVEKPTVVYEFSEVEKQPTTKSTKKRGTRKKPTTPPKAKQAKNTKE